MSSTNEQNIALNALTGLGFGIDRISPDTNILSLAKKTPTTTPLEFSEPYFLEEIIYASFLVMEGEIRANYLQYVIEMYGEELGLDHPVAPFDVFDALMAIAYEVACHRMKLAGINPTLPKDSPNLEKMIYSRFDEYNQLLKASVQCSEPIPEENWPTGLVNRQHPSGRYLGTIADYFCCALADDPDALVHLAVEIAIQLKWISTMEAVREIQSGNNLRE